MSTRPQCDCPSTALSPSQIDTYKKCARRWGFRKLAERYEPETSSQAAGKAIHDHLENYITTGVLPRLGIDKHAEPVWSAVKYLPMPSSLHRCEEHIRLDFAGGIVIHGYADLLPAEGGMVVDYKTTSVQNPPFKYALSPEQLARDTQATVYAYAICENKQLIDLRWIYLERNKPYRVHPVFTTIGRVALLASMASVVRVATEMYAHRAQCDALGAEGSSAPIIRYVNQMPANTDHCDAYGGCPHAAVCTAYKAPAFFRGVEEMSEQKVNDWMKQIKNRISQGGHVSETNNAGDEVTAQASHAPEPDVINPPVEDIGQDDTQARVAAEIKKLQEEHDKLAKAKEAKEAKAAEEAKEAKAAEEAKKAAQAAEAAKKAEASKPKPEKAKVQPQSNVQASLDRGPAGFSLSINATGKSLAECIKTAQQYISDLAAG